jgi:hypothetical protein
MKTATATKPLPAPATSAQHFTARDRHQAEVAAAQSELDGLESDEATAARGGAAAVIEHDRKIAAARARLRVAKQAVADSEQAGSEALQNEEEGRRIARYEAVATKRARIREALAEVYPALASQIAALLKDERECQAESDAVNRDLPNGKEPLDHIEAPLRWLPPVPDSEVEVEVEREVIPEGVRKVHGKGISYPKKKFKEKRIVKGRGWVRRPPLWETFMAADLKPDDPPFQVR